MPWIAQVIPGLDKLINTLSTNKGSRLWFVIVIIVAGTAAYFARGLFIHKHEPQQSSAECEYLKEQNKEFLSVILDIRRQADSAVKAAPGSHTMNFTLKATEAVFLFYDTTPRQRQAQREVQQQQVQQQIFMKILFKIDSVLLKNRLDSLRRVDSLRKNKRG